MSGQSTGRAATGPDFAAAALLIQPFTLYLAVLVLVASPTDAHWAHADPILGLLPVRSAPYVVPIVGAAIGVAVWLRARPSHAVLGRAGAFAVAGAVFATAACLALRLAVGPSLPAFVPAEESAGPGPCLSMCAGYAEEIVCRLGVLAIAWHVVSPRLPRVPAILTASIACGLSFAGLHALGEAEPSGTYFVTRLVLPGMVFSIAALAVHPAFVVAGHCAAHVFIPMLFDAR